MAEIASAYISLIPSLKGAKGSITNQIAPEGKKAGLSFSKLFAAGAALGIGAKAFSFLGDSLAEATDAAVVGARTENVIAKMGNAANISAKQVGALAMSISNKTAIDDEAIQAGQNMLLTFGNIRNEAGKGNAIFDETSRLMVDMSAAMGGDAKSAALQLGKALNDPTEGVSKLARSGVSFTEQQKEQIKTLQASGDMLGAQKIILGEVEKQFGGAGAAMATPAEKAKVAWGNLQEQFGTIILPMFNSVAAVVSGRIVPAVSSFIAGMRSGSGVGGQFAAVMTTAAAALGKVASFINSNRAAVGTFVGIIGTVIVVTRAWAASQALLNIALTANPIGLVVVAIAALAGGLVFAYKKSETFRKIVDAAFGGVRAIAASLVAFFTSRVPAAFNKVPAGASAALGWVKSNWPMILAILTGPFGIAAALIIKNWDSIQEGGERVLAFVKSIPGRVTAVFSGAATLLYNAGSQLMSGLAAGIRARIADAINEVQAGLSKIKGLLPGSPIKWGPLKNWNNGGAGKRLMGLVEDGIRSSTPKVVNAAEEAFGKIGSALEKQRDALRGTLDGLKGDFASLASSVAEAFTGDLFGVTATEAVAASEGVAAVAARSVSQNFMDNLMGKKSMLTGLLTSFKTLVGWGLDPKFLSQLFASGNGGLITEFAGMGQAGATGAASLFGEVTSLADQLGGAVAKNDPVASAISTTNTKLDEVTGQLKYLNANLGPKVAAAVERGAEKGTRKGNDDRNKDTKQRGRAGR